MEDYRWDMEEQPQFSAGSPNFHERERLAPFHEDPRAMARAAMGMLGGYGAGRAGMGMLGGALRGWNALPGIERMFEANPGMLQRLLMMRKAQADTPMQMASAGGEKLLGDGAAKRAADKIKDRRRRLDEAEDAATRQG